MSEERKELFGEKKHIPIFPTNVFEFDVNDWEELNKSIEDALSEIKNPSSLPNWSSQNNLHIIEGFSGLRERSLEAVRYVMEFLSFQFKEVSLTSLTAHTVTQADRSPPEVFSNNILSGVYCLKSGGGKVLLNDPRPQAWAIRPNVSEVSVFNTDIFVMELNQGKMIVLPSWVQRFSVFPQGETSENVYLTWTAMIQS